MSTTWTKGDRKARRQLEKALKFDETDNVTRFALVRLLASKADPAAAEVRPLLFVSTFRGVKEVLLPPGVGVRTAEQPRIQSYMRF